MRALVVPDAFKGTLTAAQVSAAIARGLRDAGVEVDERPAADGGEGTLEALRGTLGLTLLGGGGSRRARSCGAGADRPGRRRLAR